MSLTSASQLALNYIRKAQSKYKRQHDKKAVQQRYRLGDWVLVRFPQDESGMLLSEKKQNDNSANSTDEQASGQEEEVPLAQDEANEESNVEDLPDDHTVSPDQRETSRLDQATRFNLRKKPLPPDRYK